MQRFSEGLKLSSEQQEKMQLVFKTYHGEILKMRNEMSPKIKEMRQKMHQEMRKYLSPEQQEKFDKIHKERSKHGRGPRFGPGSGHFGPPMPIEEAQP